MARRDPEPVAPSRVARITVGVAGILVFAVGAVLTVQASPRVGQESARAPDARRLLSVDAGEVHTCGVRNDGTVRCWGDNAEGQLGNNTLAPSSTSVDVRGLTTATAVSAGLTHTCAVLVNGTVNCWGSNSNGQLGDNSTTRRKVPVRVQGGLTTAVSVSAGAFHTCAALSDGHVRCWGANDDGQLGDGTQTERHLPVASLRGPCCTTSEVTAATAVVAGNAHTCVLQSFGTVACWGQNAFGQLGDGTRTRRLRETTVRLGSGQPLSDVVALAAGAFHNCAVTGAGAAFCWGQNADGQIDGTRTDHLTPVPIASLTGAVTVSAGAQHTCVLRASGSAVCLGNNLFGQLGDGTFTSRSSFGAVRGLANVLAVTAGGAHTCSAQADASVRCWGLNSSGQLGDGTTATSNRPVLAPDLASAVPEATFVSGRDIAAGGTHTCALRATGAVSCWGANDVGQGGRVFSGPSSVPDAVGGLGNVQAITAGHRHTCALGAAGAVSCWGLNEQGQLGDTTQVNRSQPTLVGGLATQARAVVPGVAHTCAVLATGQVRCWGGNVFGQLGDGTTDDLSTVPRIVDLEPPAVAIAAGGAHTCAIATDRQIHCWGLGIFGQLGAEDAHFVERTPVTVATLFDPVAIAAGTLHTCAIEPEGVVWCWGDNQNGQLGNNSRTPRQTPDLVVDLEGVVAITAGGSHTCALRVDGRVWCWGDNQSGQLGDGTRTEHLRPVRVSGLADAVAVSAGERHTCALRVDGAVFCWGENSGDDDTGAGQLGDGTTEDRTAPVEVPGFRANVAPAATLAARGRLVHLTAVVNCPVGHLVTIDMRLTQDGASGEGQASAQCAGGLTGYPVQVLSRQGDPFAAGEAAAEITATVRAGNDIVDVHEWARAVQIAPAP